MFAKEQCRLVYNRLLEECNAGTKGRNQLSKFLTRLKLEWPELNEVYSKCLQPEVDRLLQNMRGMDEMMKRGRKVGKPRFKSPHRFKTFTYNQSGFKLLPNTAKFGFLHLSKIGDIPIRLHREVHGNIKGITVKHMPSGKWFAYLLVDYDRGADELTIVEKAVGIDVGLEHYAVDSVGNEVENPRWLSRELKKLRREQRKLHKRELGGRNREKQRVIVARTYERVKNQRDDFQHKLSHQYVDNYDLIVTEKLKPLNMVKNRRLSRDVSDVSWSSLNSKIAYKAERAGKLFVQADARYTSQICPGCGTIAPKTLSQRVHRCPCGYKDTRDHASSLVILKRGLQKLRSERPELKLVDSRPLQPSVRGLQADWMKQEALPAKAK